MPEQIYIGKPEYKKLTEMSDLTLLSSPVKIMTRKSIFPNLILKENKQKSRDQGSSKISSGGGGDGGGGNDGGDDHTSVLHMQGLQHIGIDSYSKRLPQGFERNRGNYVERRDIQVLLHTSGSHYPHSAVAAERFHARAHNPNLADHSLPASNAMPTLVSYLPLLWVVVHPSSCGFHKS